MNALFDGPAGARGALRPARAITPETIAPHRARIAEFVKGAQPSLSEFACEFGYDINI